MLQLVTLRYIYNSLITEHEQIWKTILEDKLARKSSSTTMSYFLITDIIHFRFLATQTNLKALYMFHC